MRFKPYTDSDGLYITEEVHLTDKYRIIEYCDGTIGITDAKVRV